MLFREEQASDKAAVNDETLKNRVVQRQRSSELIAEQNFSANVVQQCICTVEVDGENPTDREKSHQSFVRISSATFDQEENVPYGTFESDVADTNALVTVTSNDDDELELNKCCYNPIGKNFGIFGECLDDEQQVIEERQLSVGGSAMMNALVRNSATPVEEDDIVTVLPSEESHIGGEFIDRSAHLRDNSVDDDTKIAEQKARKDQSMSYEVENLTVFRSYEENQLESGNVAEDCESLLRVQTQEKGAIVNEEEQGASSNLQTLSEGK